MEFDKTMLAYCGIYCGQCSFKTAYDEQDTKHLACIPYTFVQKDLSEYNCGGCRGDCICGPCKIKPCASAKQIDSCADCGEFPCARISAFANDGIPHHADAMKNLQSIREYGREAWVEKLMPELECRCGERQTWYYRCSCINKKPGNGHSPESELVCTE